MNFRHLNGVVANVAALFLLFMVLFFYSDVSFAQLTPPKIPFGIGGAEGAATAPSNALAAWILAQQSAFYKAISAAVLAAKTDGMAVWYLAGLSFAYGVFHAAGPGHGKAIIASYVVASGSALKRGTMLAFMAAVLQALVAISIIGIIALVLRGTARDMTTAASYIEMLSYAAMFLLGLWLVWRKGRVLLLSINRVHVHSADCDHDHMPDPIRMVQNLNMREALAIVVSAGLRPCTGAILVLVFAMAQGILWVGVIAVFAMSVGTAITTSSIAALAVFAKGLALRFASGSSRFSAIFMRLVEFVAAIFIALLGAGLLFGFLAGQGS